MLRAELTEHGDRARAVQPVLSIVVPVYNLAGAIVGNVRTITERVGARLDEPFEVIVVSDGSFDASEERLLESGSELARVIHYDRNLGKGYAVKAGLLAARGTYVSYIDADLDLDPASLPDYLETARGEGLDFVIGSKRHPDSSIHYPRWRRIGSWLYQQLVRVLFRLDVRDTQVGLKLFRQEVAEQVVPLLLVKQYAFDLELLAVARSLGFDRIREMPVRLQYRFTGSGVRLGAVLLALLDTAAIFYRLRVLGYYERKRELLADHARARSDPLVTLVSTDRDQWRRLDYPNTDFVETDGNLPEARRDAARSARGDILAFVEAGGVPAGNWLDSTVPFLEAPEIAAVVTATMTPAQGSLRSRAAAAIAESRIGGGSHYFRFTPGNLAFVRQFPAGNVVVRKDDLLALDVDSMHPAKLCAALADRGLKVLYSPEAIVVASRPPLFRPHLELINRAGRVRGTAMRRFGLRGVTAASIPPLGLLIFLTFAWPLLLLGGRWRLTWTGVLAAYVGVVLVASALAALQFRSIRVGALAAVGTVAVHLTYAVGVVRGLMQRSPE